MITVKRKWRVTLYMRSGAKIKIRVDDLVQRKTGNTLTELRYPGAKVVDYLRLDEIEAITSRRCWLHWRFA